MKRIIQTIAGALVFTGLAPACENSVELPRHEREFRSQYRGSSVAPEASPSAPESGPSAWLLFGAGGAMLASAVGMTLLRFRTEK
jgi:hypothetical protein